MSKNKNDNLNLGLMAGVAAVAAGFAYYLGYKSGTENCHTVENHPRENHPRENHPRENHPRENHPRENHQSTRPSATWEKCDSPENCAICLKKMKPVKRLDCGHNFHDACVSEWLPTSPTCPLCRKTHPDEA